VKSVEPLDRRVVDDEHVDVARRAAQRGQGAFGGPGEPRRRHRRSILVIRDGRRHQDGLGVGPRSPFRASCAS
jgi:hypothetical protein